MPAFSVNLGDIELFVDHMACENVHIRQLLALIVAKYKLANFLVNAMEEASF